MQRLIFLILTLPLLLSGCGGLLKTEFQPPTATVPEQWTAETENVEGSPAEWPEDFGDPTLARLVKLALERNNDLAAAAIKVRKARLQAGLAQDNLYPDLSAGFSTNTQKKLSKGKEWITTHSVDGSISYEADLWGRLSRTRDAAEWEALATEQDRQSTALALVGTTMTLYWEIAYDNVRLALSRSNLESAGQTLQLVESQERYGAASSLEVNEARQDLTSLKSTHQSLLQDRREDLNALAVLFDMPPGRVMAAPEDLTLATLPAIPAGLPAQLLGRRPDLRAAELRLREYLAETDAAKAAFYPTLSLTGSLGSTSTQLANVLDNPIAALASSLALPFLNWNNLDLNLKVSKADYDEAVITFRQTLYEAMAEVENGLSDRDRLAAQAALLVENLKAAREVERIYEVRYQSGSGTLRDWLNAQDSRRSAEESLAENRYSRLANFVTLYQALGGQPASETENGQPSEKTARSDIVQE